MTKNVLSALFNAARGLLRSFGALVVLAILYAALIVAGVVFVTTREASLFQIAVTAAAAVAVPVLFFLAASACAAYAVGESRAFGVVGRALRGFLKVLIVSIPVVALVAGTAWGLNKLENRVKHDPREEASAEFSGHEQTDEAGEEAPPPKPPVRWAYVFYSALRLFLLGVLLPLFAIHLWIVAVRDGLKASLLRVHRTLARAVSARSVFTYAVGMIVFALLPYFLIIKRTPSNTGWLELSFLSTRLLVSFALTLFGFVTTMTALARDGSGGETAAAPAPQPAPVPRVEETTATVAG